MVLTRSQSRRQTGIQQFTNVNRSRTMTTATTYAAAAATAAAMTARSTTRSRSRSRTGSRGSGRIGRGGSGGAGGGAVGGAGGGGGPPGGPPGGAPVGAPGGAPIPFALTPGQAPTRLIDYTTKEGRKSFYKDTEKLPEVFDGQSEEITLFQSQLKDKATACGWNNGHVTEDIINIPMLIATPGDTREIIQEYTQLSKEAITAWSTANIVLNQDRRAQNNYNMYMCMKNSISANMQNMMELDRKHYTVQNIVIAALYYKALISKAEIGTQATIALTRNALTRLDQKMIAVDSNIEKFNAFVKACRRKLSDHRTHSSDLLINFSQGTRPPGTPSLWKPSARLKRIICMENHRT
jgi:hypothetical protein